MTSTEILNKIRNTGHAFGLISARKTGFACICYIFCTSPFFHNQKKLLNRAYIHGRSFSDRFAGSPDSFFLLTIHKKIVSFNKKVVIVFSTELIYDLLNRIIIYVRNVREAILTLRTVQYKPWSTFFKTTITDYSQILLSCRIFCFLYTQVKTLKHF